MSEEVTDREADNRDEHKQVHPSHRTKSSGTISDRTHSDWELRLVSFIVSCSLMKVRCRSARSRRLLRAGVTPASASGGIKVRGQRSRVKCHRHCQY